MPSGMPKVSIPDKMRCPLRVQYREIRLLNPKKVDCFAAQTPRFLNSTKQHASLSYSPRTRFQN